MPDSALFYGEKALAAIRDSSIFNFEIYRQTAQMAAWQQQYRQASRYFEEALRLSLRYTDERSKQSLVEIEKRYDVLRLKQEATEQAAQLYLVIVLLLLVALAITGLFRWQRLKSQAQRDQMSSKLQNNKIASSALQLMLNHISSLDDKIEVLFSKQHLDAAELKDEVQKLKKKMRKEALDSLYCLLVENQFLPTAMEGSTAKLTREERVLHYFVQQDWNNQQLAKLLQISPKVIKVKKYQVKQKLEGGTPS
jgi:DNA-binding CsgD family transcriptional regulator